MYVYAVFRIFNHSFNTHILRLDVYDIVSHICNKINHRYASLSRKAACLYAQSFLALLFNDECSVDSEFLNYK